MQHAGLDAEGGRGLAEERRRSNTGEIDATYDTFLECLAYQIQTHFSRKAKEKAMKQVNSSHRTPSPQTFAIARRRARGPRTRVCLNYTIG